MPANAAIVINDGKASPASHTFTPIKVDGGAAYFRDLSMSPAGVADTLIMSLKDTGKLRTAKISIVRPRAVTETVNGVVNTKVGDFASIGVVVNIPLTWAEADVKDCRVMTSNALLNALVLALVDQGAFVY